LIALSFSFPAGGAGIPDFSGIPAEKNFWLRKSSHCAVVEAT